MDYLESRLYWFFSLSLFIAVLCSFVEASYLSFDRVLINRLKTEKNILSRIISHFIKRIKFFLVTVLLLHLIANIFAAWLFTRVLQVHFKDFVDLSNVLVNIVVLVGFTIFMMLFMEFIPKQLGFFFNRSVAYCLTPFFLIPYAVFYPISHGYYSLFEALFSRRDAAKDIASDLDKGELLQYIKLSSEMGVLSKVESVMIKNVLQHKDLPARTIMVPRVHIKAFDIEDLPKRFLQVLRRFEYNHVIIYRRSLDNILGLFHKKDLFYERALVNLDKSNVLKYLKPPKFVLDSMSIIDVFEKIHEEGSDVLFALDEFGGFQGIVTYHDIIGEVLGRISFHDVERSGEIRFLGSKYYLVKGALSIIAYNQYFASDLDHKNVETIGGYVVENMGRIPSEGETFNDGSFIYTVKKADEKHIEEILVEKLVKASSYGA